MNNLLYNITHHGYVRFTTILARLVLFIQKIFCKRLLIIRLNDTEDNHLQRHRHLSDDDNIFLYTDTIEKIISVLQQYNIPIKYICPETDMAGHIVYKTVNYQATNKINQGTLLKQISRTFF